MPYVMFGYKCSEHASTKVSPYSIMHAVEPTIPLAIKSRFEGFVDTDDPERAAVSQCAQQCSTAPDYNPSRGNLLIAQYRETLRYALMHGRVRLPVLRRLNPGDYVYHRNNSARASLDAKAQPGIYSIMEQSPAESLCWKDNAAQPSPPT